MGDITKFLPSVGESITYINRAGKMTHTRTHTGAGANRSSGSDHMRSQIGPSWGISWKRSSCCICGRARPSAPGPRRRAHGGEGVRQRGRGLAAGAERVGNLRDGVEGRAEAAVGAEELLVDGGSQRKIVEEVLRAAGRPQSGIRRSDSADAACESSRRAERNEGMDVDVQACEKGRRYKDAWMNINIGQRDQVHRDFDVNSAMLHRQEQPLKMQDVSP